MAQAQLDMFAEADGELFAAEPVVFRPDADRVRKRLAAMLSEMRGATSPLDFERRRYLEKVVPQMSLALPEEEAAEIKLAFERELERLA